MSTVYLNNWVIAQRAIKDSKFLSKEYIERRNVLIKIILTSKTFVV